jgi:carbon-monoxide dehydrogenase medium subunit
MKPAPFEYHAPTSLADAVTLLARLEDEGCDAKILAGGQSLMPMLAMRVARPDALVDLRHVPGLDHIRLQDGRIAIGAMASKRSVELSELVREHQPLFHAATRLVGHQQIRNRGSVGGSFAHADPASEYPAVALVLDMEMVATGPEGERVIPAAEFFVTYMTTALEPGEILTEIRMPVLPTGTGWAIREITRRNGDLALAGVALTLHVDSGRCADARIAAFGIDATAVRLSAAEETLRGAVPNTETFARAAAVAAASLADPMSCIHASADYRRHLVGTLLERALAEAAARAR